MSLERQKHSLVLMYTNKHISRGLYSDWLTADAVLSDIPFRYLTASVLWASSAKLRIAPSTAS